MRRFLIASAAAASAVSIGATFVPLASPAAAAPVASPNFTETDIRVGRGPVDVVVADFDGRNGLDFATIESSDAMRTFPHGGGHRSFLPPQVIAVGESPQYLTVGDFDQNTDPDLAVVNSNDDSVTILLGVAGGGFVREADIDVGHIPEGIVALDTNGDFDLDLAVTNAIAGEVSILVGGPGGSFSLHRTAFEVGSFPRSIASGDFDGNGDPDLAVVDSSDDGVSVPYGVAGPNFAGRQAFYTGDKPVDLVVTDLNGDLDPDIAVVNQDSRTLAIAMGQPSTGVFESPQLYATGAAPTAIAAADMDGNGLQDLVVSNGSADTVRLYFQKGTTSQSVSLEANANPVEAGRFATLSADASEPDGEVAFYDWDLDGNGTFEVMSTRSSSRDVGPVPAGTTTYRVRVIDDDGNTAEASIDIRAGARPSAVLRASSTVVETGQTVTLDASGSRDEDSTDLHYRFDTDGNGTYETEQREPTVRSAPVPAGGDTYGVQVIDEIGLVDTGFVFVNAGQRPVARLVAQPPAVLVGEGVTLDATSSTSTNGSLTDAFDVDNDGTYETSDADGRLAIAPYPSSGTRTYGVRVTDGAGLWSTATTSVSVGRVAPKLTARSIVGSLGSSVAATLTRVSSGQPVAGRTLVFTTPAGATICIAVTNASGKGECTSPLHLVAALLSLGYRATFGGDATSLPSAASAGLL